MKTKPPLLSILVVAVLMACGVTDIQSLVQPAPARPPTITSAPATVTPSLAVFPTHTSTPTLTGLQTEIAPTFPPPLSATSAPATEAATPSAGAAVTPTAAATGLIGTGFSAINLSSAVFYWGACQPTTVTVTATVANPAQIDSVVLFTRVGNKVTGFATSWDKGASMTVVGPGVYSRTLNGMHMGVTRDSWIQFQLVGTDSQDQVMARSPVYHDALSLSPCP